jgi:hypothetical protein
MCLSPSNWFARRVSARYVAPDVWWKQRNTALAKISVHPHHLLLMQAPPSPLSSRPERSAAEGSAVFSTRNQSKRPSTLTLKINCHPDRSEAKWRDLLFRASPSSTPEGSATFPFVIPTEAKRSGGICSFSPPATKANGPNPHPQNKLSSRPKRSEVEGPAVLKVSSKLPQGFARLPQPSDAS